MHTHQPELGGLRRIDEATRGYRPTYTLDNFLPGIRPRGRCARSSFLGAFVCYAASSGFSLVFPSAKRNLRMEAGAETPCNSTSCVRGAGRRIERDAMTRSSRSVVVVFDVVREPLGVASIPLSPRRPSLRLALLGQLLVRIIRRGAAQRAPLEPVERRPASVEGLHLTTHAVTSRRLIPQTPAAAAAAAAASSISILSCTPSHPRRTTSSITLPRSFSRASAMDMSELR